MKMACVVAWVNQFTKQFILFEEPWSTYRTITYDRALLSDDPEDMQNVGLLEGVKERDGTPGHKYTTFQTMRALL